MDYKKLRDTRNSSNPFAQRLGIFVEEIGPGYARAVKDITAEDANPVGVAHGGCYFSLADTACGSAMASHGYYAVTVNASYNFLRSAKLGDHLVAEARETKPGRTLCFYEVEIRDQAGTLLGNGSITFYKLDREIPL
ncbi:PaaI family thioesterase [Oscillibacter sp. KLE 1728]|uniref:PaaI family thioesterase n=1 Tax=Oscillibacter sp. KLE 1728 TaxID=1226322 RepID=UPI002590A92B|nr:PaaI family thioesterase [Oscillibacter sp. KLE 1728]